MARVWLVIACSILVGSISSVSFRTSTNTGVAPVETIAETVGIAVFGTVMTSSPGPIPSARRARNSASVPLFTPFPPVRLE